MALARLRLPTGPRACELAAVALVVLFAALVLAPLTLLHELPNAYDTDAFYAPYAAFLHDRLSHGDFPLWNPFAFSGQPWAADPQSGVLYPPALASYGLFAPATGWSCSSRFHYLLATLSSYSFARLLGAGRLGAVYAGLAFGVSGYLLARSQALGLLTGAAWLAAGVAAAQYAVHREGRGASPLVLAGALALSILGGSQQLTAVAATAALVVLVLQLRRRGLAIFVGAGLVALGLAAVALLPRLELVVALDAPRTASSIRPASARSAGPTRKLIFGSFGSHAGELAPLYAGALTPALARARDRAPLERPRACPPRSACSRSRGRRASRATSRTRSGRCARSPPTRRCAHCRSWRWPSPCSAGLALGSPRRRPSPFAVAVIAVVIALVVSPSVP